jgi:hypothetical protein
LSANSLIFDSRRDAALSDSETEESENLVKRGGKFYAFFPKLQAHIEAKTGSRLVAMIIRGLVDPGKEGIQ